MVALFSRTTLMFECRCFLLSQECLAEQWSRSHPLSLCKRLQRLAVLGMAWTLVLATVLICVVGVYYFSEFIHQVSSRQDPQGACVVLSCSPGSWLAGCLSGAHTLAGRGPGTACRNYIFGLQLSLSEAGRF